MGARLKFWRRSPVPKKGSRDEAVGISRGFADRDGSAVKSHSTTTKYRQLRRLLNTISMSDFFYLSDFCHQLVLCARDS